MRQFIIVYSNTVHITAPSGVRPPAEACQGVDLMPERISSPSA
jgi:hypothetical protein